MARTCSRCGEAGHDIRTCDVPPGHGVLMSIRLDEDGYGYWTPRCTVCSWEGSEHGVRDDALSEGGRHHEATRGG